MTTKEQERKALQQIQKIIESLGEDSYIATALEGCLEIAAENIENDFACSMQQRAESAEKRAEALRNDLDGTAAKLADIESEYYSLQADHELLKGERDTLREAIEAMHTELIETREQLKTARAEGDEMDNQIIHLKAQLYDYMTM